jgi:hypothetical protein
MGMNKSGMLFLISALLVASSVHAEVEIKPYGFIQPIYVESWGRPNLNDNPTQATSANSSTPPNQNISNMSARNSRIGLNVSGGKGPFDMDLSGIVEADFYGLTYANNANIDGEESAPRMRLAYVQMTRGNQTVVFGQDWDSALSPNHPTSILHASVGTNTGGAGDLWNRLPQLRWDSKWEVMGDWSVNTKLAVVNSYSSDEAGRVATCTVTGGATCTTTATNATTSDTAGSGNASGGPAYQALVELQRVIDGRPFKIGVSGQYLRQSFSAYNPAPAGVINPSAHMNGTLYHVHFDLPVLSFLDVKGAGFYGNSDFNNNGLGVVYNNNSSVASSMSHGGWVGIEGKLNSKVYCDATYGGESTYEGAIAAAGIYRNEVLSASANWDVSPEFTLSLEGWNIHSYFKAALAGDSIGTGLAARYKFGPQHKTAEGY